VAVVAFGWSLAGTFHFDDYSLWSARAVVSPAGPLELLKPLQSRPLTYLTFWANYQTAGFSPLAWHLVNLLMHIGSVLLLFAALRRLLPERAAMLAAALFAVHPLNAEAVNYIFARSTLLCTLLSLAALRSWVNNRPWHAVGWFAGALLAKEECVTLPLFLLLLNLAASRGRREWKPIAAMLGLSLAAGARVMLAAMYTPGAKTGPSAGISALEYLSSQGVAILRYLRLLLIPAGLTVDPDLRVNTGWTAWLAWIAVIALCIAASRIFSPLRAGFWLLAGLILLLPSSSIFPAADLAADRRMYLPMIAFATGGAMLLYTMRIRALIVVCASLAAISISRCEIWRTELTLWTEAVRMAPDKLRPRIQLSRALPPMRALSVLNEAEQTWPLASEVPAEEGRIYLDMGESGQALAKFGRALALEPTNPMAINNRGAALLALGQTDAARLDFQRALKIDPCQPNARANLAHMGVAPPAADSCPEIPVLTVLR